MNLTSIFCSVTMEVVKGNFNELLPKIKEAITQSTFITIDTELTGLSTGSDISGYDTPRQYYEKIKKTSKNFLVVQFGLCTFRYDNEKNRFTQQGYNFYIFPKSNNKYIPDRRFLCQTSSIDFLTSCGFDFNKLFKCGISYLNSNEEAKYRDLLAEAQKIRTHNLNTPQNDTSNLISIPAEDKPFVDDVLKKIDEFIESDHQELALPRCNAFVRRLIYQSTREKSGKINLVTRQLENKDRILFVTRVKTKLELQLEDQKKVANELNEFEDSVGFSKVIKHIVESGKVVVGHNMCLDLLHIIDKFLTPLPEDYEEFKDCAHCLFSRIVDTKYMSSIPPIKDLVTSNVLKHLLETVSAEPFGLPRVEMDENGVGYSLEKELEHEAGYDAFITGLSFLGMWKYLKDQEKSESYEISTLSPFVNKLFLMRLQDSVHTNLGGPDPNPSRDHVFHLTFPRDWKLNDIIQLFSPFGPVNVAWIDDNSAYVGLHRRDQAGIAFSTLSKCDRCTLTTYQKRQGQLMGQKILMASPLSINRKKGLDCSSSKKRKIGSLLRSDIETIIEEGETDDLKSTSTKRFKVDTFEENDNWN